MTYCIRCGIVTADGIRFCKECGLESMSAQTQPFPDAPPGSSLNPQFDMVLRFAGPILPLIGLFLALYFVVTQPGGIGRLSRPGTATTIVSPTFDCAKAKTLTEQQICRDPQLASLERGMVSSYNQALAQLPADQKAAFRRKHALWFKDYSRTCNSIPADETRKNCIASYLTSHTQQLELALRAESTPGDRGDAPQSASLTGAILGKWYPVSAGPPPHAGLFGYEFLPGGRVREILYINPVFNGGKDETDILCEDDGYYQIAGSTLTIRVLKNEDTFQIVEIPQGQLVLEERFGTVVGSRVQYARNPSSGYPLFGAHGTISIRFDWPQETVNFGTGLILVAPH